jgi:hypothetical protein
MRTQVTEYPQVSPNRARVTPTRRTRACSDTCGYQVVGEGP